MSDWSVGGHHVLGFDVGLHISDMVSLGGNTRCHQK